MPTEIEKADLLQALYSRNGESLVVVLVRSLRRIALKLSLIVACIRLFYPTPVIVLSDGVIANGS